MSTYRNPRTEYRYGTIPTFLSADKIGALREFAASISGERVSFTLPKFTPADKQPNPFGDVNSKHGSEVTRRRWAAAYFLTVAVMRVAIGTVWLPCYLCGKGFHAWTMDAEHVNPSDGARVGNLMLSCSGCNTSKGDSRIPAHQTRELLYREAYGMTYPRGSASIEPIWYACPRRQDGSEQSSTPYTR